MSIYRETEAFLFIGDGWVGGGKEVRALSEWKNICNYCRHRSGRRRSSLDFGSASTDQSRGRVKKNGGRKKKKGEHLDKSMIVLPSGRRIRGCCFRRRFRDNIMHSGNLNELITARELHDLEEELETSRRLGTLCSKLNSEWDIFSGRMTDRLKLKNELSRLDHALSQTETAWKSEFWSNIWQRS